MAGNQNTSSSPGTGSGGGAAGATGGASANEGDAYDLSVDPVIATLTDENLEHLSAALRDLIAHRIAGINYAEGRRGQLATIGGAIFAAGVALLPFASGVDYVPLKWVYLELAAASVLLGVLVWIVYARQTNYDYPFKTELKNWKWFYHQALPDKSKFGPGLVQGRSEKDRTAERGQSAAQWPIFAEQANGLSTPRVDATQDLKQLYQLHVNERYKNLFLSRLRNLLVYGLVVTVVGALLTFVTAWALYDAPDRAHRSDWEGDGIAMPATWKETGAVRSDGLSTHDVQFRLQSRLTNQSAKDVTWTGLVMLDQDGDPIPAEFSLSPDSSALVKPGHTLTVEGYFWVAGFDREQLRTLIPR